MGARSNGRRIQVRISDRMRELFDKEVEQQRDLFGYVSESEVAARLIYKALTAGSGDEEKKGVIT